MNKTQCACIGTSRRAHEIIVQVEKQKYYIFLCVAVGAMARACACARVALITHHATRRHIVIYGFSGYTNFFDIIS